MRVWRNAMLSFGLSNVPVGVVPAISDKHTSFRTLHEECGTPIKQQNWCEKCNKVAETTVRGIEFPKDSFIRITDEEYATTRSEFSNVIKLNKFVPADMLNDMLFDKPMWLQPSELQIFAGLYGALNLALQQNELFGLGMMTLTELEHPCAVVAGSQGLSLWSLRSPESIVTPDYQVPSADKEVLEQAILLTMLLEGGLEPGDFALPGREREKLLVEAKMTGMKLEPVEPVKVEPTVDVLQMLRESVAELQKQKARRSPAKKRTKAGS